MDSTYVVQKVSKIKRTELVVVNMVAETRTEIRIKASTTFAKGSIFLTICFR